MNLFKTGNFKSAAGLDLTWKIECDALTNEDWQTIAMVGAERLPSFRMVIGIPRGGLQLASHMEKYVKPTGPVLIVDDVFTTGKTINEYMKQYDPWDVFGYVAFARSARPDGRIFCFADIF